MKYYSTNTLIIEFPTKFLGMATEKTVTGRVKWKVAFTELTGEKVRIITRGSKLTEGRGNRIGHRSRQNIILVDVYAQKEQFIDAISRFFSEKFNIKPSDLNFQFENPFDDQAFGDLNAT